MVQITVRKPACWETLACLSGERTISYCVGADNLICEAKLVKVYEGGCRYYRSIDAPALEDSDNCLMNGNILDSLNITRS